MLPGSTAFVRVTFYGDFVRRALRSGASAHPALPRSQNGYRTAETGNDVVVAAAASADALLFR